MASSPESLPSSIIARAKAILLNPAQEWPKIAAEETPTRDIFMRYVLPLALIGPVCGFIGSQVFGYGAFGVSFKPSFVSALIGGIVAFVLAIASFMVLTLIVDFLSPKFGGATSHERSFKLVAYASTAVWVVGLFTLIPMLGLLSVLALYSIYLIYAGATPMLNIAKDKAAGFTAAVIGCGLILNLVVGGLMAMNMRMLSGMGLMGSADSEVSGTLTLPTGEKVDMAKMGDIAKSAEDAANGKSPPVAPAKLQALLPETIGSYKRIATESTGMGMGSNAEGKYEDSSGHRFTLKVTDMSALGAMAGIGAALGVEQNREDADGYEKTGTVDGRMQSESWRKDGSSGKFGIVFANRFMVEADGSTGSIDELKAAVATIDPGTLEGLVE